MTIPLKIVGTPEGSRLACAVALINLAVQSDEDWPARRRYLQDAAARIETAINTIDGWQGKTGLPSNPFAGVSSVERTPTFQPAVDPESSGRELYRPFLSQFVASRCELDPAAWVSIDILYSDFDRQSTVITEKKAFLRHLLFLYPSIAPEMVSRNDAMGATLLRGIRLKKMEVITDFLDDGDDQPVAATDFTKHISIPQ